MPATFLEVTSDAVKKIADLALGGSRFFAGLRLAWRRSLRILEIGVVVGAVALGCVSAAALGQVAVGIPCVIGGSASQGLLSFWEKQQQ